LSYERFSRFVNASSGSASGGGSGGEASVPIVLPALAPPVKRKKNH